MLRININYNCETLITISKLKEEKNKKKIMSESEAFKNKTWDLSLYELNRLPQEIITDNTEIAVSPRSLHSELM